MKYEEGTYEGSSSWMLAFFLGGLVGAGVALLLAPKPGTQTRQQIKDVAGKAGDYYGQVKGKIGDVVEKGKDVFQEKASEIKEEGAAAYHHAKASAE